MAKRRERRANPQPELSQTSSADKPSGSSTKPDRNRTAAAATAATVLLLIAIPAISVVLYRILYASSSDTPDLPYVYQRGLVTAKIDYHQVLRVCLLDLFSSKLYLYSFLLY